MMRLGYETAMQATRRETSDEAHDGAAMSATREAVLDAIRRRPSTSDEMIADGLGEHQSVSATVNWLFREGHVIDSGERRRTRSNRSAIVWRAVDAPVPIREARPTRRELQRRIDAAIARLESPGLTSRTEILGILKGGN